MMLIQPPIPQEVLNACMDTALEGYAAHGRGYVVLMPEEDTILYLTVLPPAAVIGAKELNALRLHVNTYRTIDQMVLCYSTDDELLFMLVSPKIKYLN